MKNCQNFEEMSPSSKDFSQFSDVLGGIRLPKTVKEHLKNHEIWSRWTEIVGYELSRLTSPLELKSKILEIQVAHQAWAQQLQFLKPSILNKIRSLCPNTQVKDLLFRVGKVEPVRSPNTESDAFEKKIKSRLPRLTERQELTLRAVEDPDLRAVIRQAMEAASKRSA